MTRADRAEVWSLPQLQWMGVGNWAGEYMLDFAERSILFWDVMRMRGNQYLEHIAQKAPHVLSFKCELLLDGRQLARPVNYVLVRIVPPDGEQVDPTKRPFVIVDPRAGHGPGIGGFKADSEIGVALGSGHPCYFIGFLPDPVRGQTIEDVTAAEALFLEKVIELHPESDGKPAVIGNCQAGWAVMILAALRPELFGPTVIAGSPLSYWAGVHGVNPMRYTGGLLGGSWLAALSSDCGNGLFDGAWLVQNFESLNPSNTFWTKQYNLFAKIDTEPPRYLEFERWWGGHVLLTAGEIQFIVDNLFVGNKLVAGEITTHDGRRVDLRAITSPILVFCSQGDNITPPQQALGWILDLYDSVDDIRMYGQTIVYCVHTSIGHLGIFVSGGVARKEHGEFASNIDLIDVLPPGLYEIVLEPKKAEDASVTLVEGDYVARFEPRTLDHIRALGSNDPEDDRRFATVARISEINAGLYNTFVAPWLRAFANEPAAQLMRRLHPARLQYELASDKNPLMMGVAALAERVRRERHPVHSSNPFLQWQSECSTAMIAALDGWRDMRDWLVEQTFLNLYGSPLLQAAAGLAASDQRPRSRPGQDLQHQRFVAHRTRELLASIGSGGLREAGIRAMIYIGLAEGTVDERGFNVLRQIRSEHPEASLAEFKEIVREQFYMLILDEEKAVAAIPAMLRNDRQRIPDLLAALRRVMTARGAPTQGRARRLERIEALLQEAGGSATQAAVSDVIRVAPVRSAQTPQAKKAKPPRHATEPSKL